MRLPVFVSKRRSIFSIPKLPRSYSTYLILQIVIRAVSLLNVVILLRRLDLAVFGTFTYIQTSALAVAGVSALGLEISLNVALRKARLEGRSCWTPSLAGISIAISGLLVSFPIILSYNYVFEPKTEAIPLGSTLIYVLAAVSVAQSLSNGLCYGFGKMAIAVCGPATSSFVFLLVSIFAVPESFIWVTSFYIASQLIGVIFQIALFLLSLYRGKTTFVRSFPNWSLFFNSVKELWLFGLKNALIIVLTNIVLWLLQHRILTTEGPVENARYSIGIQIFSAVIFLPQVAGPIILARLMSGKYNVAQQRRFSNILTAIFVLASLIISGAATLFIYWALPYLPPRYAGSYWVALLAAGAAGAQFAKAPMSIYFQSKLRMLPDLVGGLAALVVILIVIFALNKVVAEAAMAARLVGTLVTLGIVAVFFARNRNG